MKTDSEIFKSFDARVWAEAFVEHQKANPEIATDEACMTTWFASALMRGHDECYYKSDEYRREVRRVTMPWWKRLFVPLALCFVLLASSCGNPTTSTPAPPNSAQTTVAQLNNTVADADLAAVKTVIALRDAGKLSQANTLTIENWLALVATTNKSIGLILVKPEPWTAQKAEILTLLATTTAPTIATTIDPAASTVIAQIQTLIAQIRTQVTQ